MMIVLSYIWKELQWKNKIIKIKKKKEFNVPEAKDSQTRL